jgi:hypothetical protein
MITDHDDPKCPSCGVPTVWDLQDTYKLNGRIFSQRLQICSYNCGWVGVLALFQWRGTKEMPLYLPKLPDDPFEDTVPMLPPEDAP